MIFKYYSLDLGLQGSFAQNLCYFGTNKEALNQSVYRYGAETKTHDALKGFEYGYRIGVPGTYGEGKVIARRNQDKRPRINSQKMKNFESSVDSLISLRNAFQGYGLGMAILMAGLIVAQFVPIANIVADAIAGVLGGGLGPGGATALAYLVIQYVNASNSARKNFENL